MKIVVASLKQPKRLAVEQAFTKAFPGQSIEVVAVETDSKVTAHPTSPEESLAGAMNRAKHAQEQVADANYYVGLEGGLLQAGGKAWEIGWVAIIDKHGVIGFGSSAGLQIEGSVLRAIKNGKELKEVLRDDYGITDASKTTNFYGLVTNDLVSREAANEQAVLFALARFLHPEFYL